MQTTPAILPFSMSKEVGHPSLQRYFAEETFKVLSNTVPFNVRFRQDHSLIGRAIYFSLAMNSSPDYVLYLQVCIEYPIGSGKVFQSASGVGTQMYIDCGGVCKVCTDGYRDLEYQQDFYKDDWIILGELITEEVRFFGGPLKKELLPQPYVDQRYPIIPSQDMNYTTSLITRKRELCNDEENHTCNSSGPSSSFELAGDPPPYPWPHPNGEY